MAAVGSRAKVIAASLITPTVRWFQFESLNCNSSSHRFYAGQWLDLYIPGSDVIGGYSMCSSPIEFDKSGRFDLAVKLSDHPAAMWMHNECEVGMDLSYQFGGDIYLDHTSLALNRDCYLLVAGGVGMNPIYSILTTVLPKASRPVCLLYSVQNQQELMFSKEISKMADVYPRLTVDYILSRDTECMNELKGCAVSVGRRINEEDLKSALQKLSTDNLEVYICGPDEMITSMDACLQRHGVTENQIHYERWT